MSGGSPEARPWSEIRVIPSTDTRVVDFTPASELVAEIDGIHYFEAPETGIDAVLLSVAPSAWIVRTPVGPPSRMVQVTSVEDGESIRYEEARTAEDQEAIDDSIDGYLADAGVAPRPRGYDWFLGIPMGFATYREFFGSTVMKCQREHLHPRSLRAALLVEIAALERAGWRRGS